MTAPRTNIDIEPTLTPDIPLPTDTLSVLPFVGPIQAQLRLDIVPGYEILEELGRGGMGVVYKAKQIGLNRLVALKMILAGAHANAEARTRFRAEAEAIARLQHPHIVQVHEIGEHNGQPFFSLEFCAGGSLADRLDGTPLPPNQAAQLLVPLARAVQHAHDHGIIHRDLKPGNVLLARGASSTLALGKEEQLSRPLYVAEEQASFDPKIADFGLAKYLDGDSRTRSGDVMGTPSYMAPEQARGNIHLMGPATDVYALGAILYELLTGRPPFRAESPMETAVQVVNCDPLPVRALQPKVSRDLETISLKCLRKEPGNRYASAGALADDLERYLEGKAILARPIGSVERAWRWTRRHPTQAALVVLLLVAIAAGLGGWAWFTAQLRDERDQADFHRGIAEQRQLEADANARVATKNFELAERRYLKSLGVADRYFTQISEDTLLHEPGMQPLRQRLLRNARDFYLGFVHERRNDPRLGTEVARSFYRLAILDAELGDIEGGSAQLEDALGRFDDLLNRTPRDQNLIEERARLLNDLGRLDRLRDRSARATAAYDKARQAWEAVLRDSPSSLSAREGLARSLHGLGNVAFGQDRRAEALTYYRRALDLRRQIVEADSQNENHLRDLAITWQNLASVYSKLGQNKEMVVAHAEALAILRRLVSVQPSRSRYQNDLAMACYNEGYRLMRAHQFVPAGDRYHEAAQMFQRLAFQHPGVPVYQNRLGHTLWNYGLCLEQLGQNVPADEVFKQAHQVRKALADASTGVPEYQLAYAQSLRFDGDRLRGRMELARAAQAYQQARTVLYRTENSPTCRALLAELALKLGTVARQQGDLDLAIRYYDRALVQALALLRQRQLEDQAKQLERQARQEREATLRFKSTHRNGSTL
jgi:tetratricopeptide (TPR) repeat protein